jgi:hypothetical protein
MCMGRLCPGCRELHTGELYTRAQRAGQAEAEVFLATASWAGGGGGYPGATISLTMGGWHSAAGGARAYAASGGARVDAGASRARAYTTKGRAMSWSQCEWGR